MPNITISIFENKIFKKILSELKFFSKYKIEFFNDLKLFSNKSFEKNKIFIFFITEKNKNEYKKLNKIRFPLIAVGNKNFLNGEFMETIEEPFKIIDLEKKIVSLFSKYEFKKSSIINLNNYILDKNERKIKKDNLELQLTEKEINFLILFCNNSKPLSRKLVLEQVWNYSSESDTHTVETHVHRLRKKILEKFNDNNFIKNNNKGYYI